MKSAKYIFSLLLLTSGGLFATHVPGHMDAANDLREIAEVEKAIKAMTPQQKQQIEALVRLELAGLSEQELADMKGEFKTALKELKTRVKGAVENMAPQQIRELKNDIKSHIQAEIDKLTPAQIKTMKAEFEQEVRQKLYEPFIKPLLNNDKVSVDHKQFMQAFMGTLGETLGAYADAFDKAEGWPTRKEIRKAERDFRNNFIKMAEEKRAQVKNDERLKLAYDLLISYAKNFKHAIKQAMK